MARQLSMTANAIQKRANRAAAKAAAGKNEAAAKSEDGQSVTTLGFEEAPADTFESNDGVMAAVKKIGKAIGIQKDEPEEKGKAAPLPKSRKLSGDKQEFADTLTEPAVMLFIAVAGWLWSQLDRRFKKLAPDKKVAALIVAPLIRIYVRNSKITASVSPDATDLAASISALIGYMWTSVKLADDILAADQEQEEEEVYVRQPYAPQAASGNGSGGFNGVHQSGDSGANQTTTGTGVDFSSMSERDRQNYLALNYLRERDFAARARRSGRYGQF